ncbi:MAG TPA: DUF5698 domain-containing protein [Candidatus Hydrogenedentes bacterium]|nr:DUF5698 domain-containing protein [Candidatus Hydrogenedentota bacterium]HQM48478.1 DUF5698 domain-containing protein [Candidatus Hydrogenedentota bacterium]
MEAGVLLTGIFVFAARIVDVSMGTLRTIMAVQGRMLITFCLGFVEVIIWILVVGTVVSQIKESPALILFYALGFACGNACGIFVEAKLALGNVALKVISAKEGTALADKLRATGQPVTVFPGMGMQGPVEQLFMVCRRRDVSRLLTIVKNADPNAMVITEMVRDVNRVLHPVIGVPLTSVPPDTKEN